MRLSPSHTVAWLEVQLVQVVSRCASTSQCTRTGTLDLRVRGHLLSGVPIRLGAKRAPAVRREQVMAQIHFGPSVRVSGLAHLPAGHARRLCAWRFSAYDNQGR